MRGRGAGLRRTLRTPVHTGRDYATDPTTVKGVNPPGDAIVLEQTADAERMRSRPDYGTL